MAGFWHLSHHQLHDANGLPLVGARAFFYEAETLTPISVYQDYSLATEHPSPVVADALGIFPPVFLSEDDGFYRQRITNSAGVIVAGSDVIVIPIIGPTEGEGGAEVPVDPNSLLQTGDLKARYGTGTHSGWVRANGRTVGSATSGATERANADTEALFLYLWGADANLSVSGGRGLTAAADWAANKTIDLPDWRGRALAALDDMGNTAAGRLTVTHFGTAATALGAAGGSESNTLTSAQMPSHTHTVTDPGHVHDTGLILRGDSPGAVSVNYLTSGGGTTYDVESATTGITNQNTGGGGAHNNTQPTMLATIYIKL
jgi:microcystin-dependent protein